MIDLRVHGGASPGNISVVSGVTFAEIPPAKPKMMRPKERRQSEGDTLRIEVRVEGVS